jgi:tetratricopeptide (TPR) repeat protein
VPAPGRRPAAGGEDTRRATGRAPEPAASAPPPAEPAAGEPIRITRDGGPAAVDPGLAQGYEHLQAGRLDAAVAAYRAVLARQPGSIDALLGVAAVAVARGDPETARDLYQRVLRAEPRNAWAQAGWLSLLGQSDPAGAEAQLRELIAREPSAMLWSRLGGLLATQGRWPQAQQAYFQAHSLQPDSPDHAFNLAVSLERIAQPRIALGFLRTAVRLAETGAPARFDLAAARERIERLADSAGRP